MLENGQIARIVTVIFENYELCMIVGRLDSETVLMWDNQGKSENQEYNIDNISTKREQERINKNG
jgi:hypothetical protein